MKLKFNRVVNHSAFPISLLIIISLVTGLLTFRDYGMSWDEPLFYKYGDAVPYAYSISQRLSGNFNILNAYGPSATDHMMYGPAYLLLARPFALLTAYLFNTDIYSGWHLINFILFGIGIVFLYLLCLRWVSRWAAFCAALLFMTQPVLWGHGFINPKDIPFTVFFVLTMYSGYVMVDQMATPDQSLPDSNPKHSKLPAVKIFLWVIFLVFLLLTISVIAFKPQTIAAIPSIIREASQNPSSLPGFLFRLVANNTSSPNIEAYAAKATALFKRVPVLLIALTAVTGLVALAATLGSKQLPTIYKKFEIKIRWRYLLLASVLLGILSAIRILGPLAGLLVCLYFFLKHKHRAILGILAYGSIAFIVMYILWPYIWHSPISGVIEVLRHMSNNPQVVPILFGGEVTSSTTLPASYFPTMLALTLTEPVWILFFLGAGIAIYLITKKEEDWKELLPMGLWFLIPILYVLITTPPQYDGFRHFTFILPSVFIFTGFTFYYLFRISRAQWVNLIIVILLILPGVLGIIRLHPYEYTYYNLFIGGTNGAFRKYETDYWLTCYKDAIQQINYLNKENRNVFVYKNKYLASQYASNQYKLEQFEPSADTTQAGDWLLMTTRLNYDKSYHQDDPAIITISKNGIPYCFVKQVK